MPPHPEDMSDKTIEGIDADGDCVRDDMEHWIANKYPRQKDFQKRVWLYYYAAWLGYQLAANTDSQSKIRTASKYLSATRDCFSRIATQEEAHVVVTELFAYYHNTIERSKRYISRMRHLSGWVDWEADWDYECDIYIGNELQQ